MTEAPTIEIHPIEPEETDAAVELVKSSLGEYDAYDYDTATNDLIPDRMDDLYEEPKGRFWVAKSGEQVVGTIALRRMDDRTCKLTRLAVHADFRRQDVVQRLEQAFEDYAREAGFRRAIGELVVRQKPGATFLESVGFQEFKRSLRQKVIIVSFEKSL